MVLTKLHAFDPPEDPGEVCLLPSARHAQRRGALERAAGLLTQKAAVVSEYTDGTTDDTDAPRERGVCVCSE